MQTISRIGVIIAAAGLGISSHALAQDVNPDKIPERPKIYSPYVERTASDANLAEGVYWGDTHLHTSYSTDSGMLGNTLGPEEAYRFARGEEVLSAAGMRARLIRPLDFLVVADHAENLGLAPMIAESNPELLKNEWGRKVHDMVKAGNGRGAFQLWINDAVTKGKDPIDNPKMTRTVWEREIAFAEKYNEPGRFTAFIGFEWSSIASLETPGNLHRVVIFKDGGDKAGQVPTLQRSALDRSGEAVGLPGSLRGEDRRKRAGHRPQRQRLQRTDVPARAAQRATDRSSVRRDAKTLGTAVRGHTDEGRRRGAPLPVPQ